MGQTIEDRPTLAREATLLMSRARHGVMPWRHLTINGRVLVGSHPETPPQPLHRAPVLGASRATARVYVPRCIARRNHSSVERSPVDAVTKRDRN